MDPLVRYMKVSYFTLLIGVDINTGSSVAIKLVKYKYNHIGTSKCEAPTSNL